MVPRGKTSWTPPGRLCQEEPARGWITENWAYASGAQVDSEDYKSHSLKLWEHWNLLLLRGMLLSNSFHGCFTETIAQIILMYQMEYSLGISWLVIFFFLLLLMGILKLMS